MVMVITEMLYLVQHAYMDKYRTMGLKIQSEWGL